MITEQFINMVAAMCMDASCILLRAYGCPNEEPWEKVDESYRELIRDEVRTILQHPFEPADQLWTKMDWLDADYASAKPEDRAHFNITLAIVRTMQATLLQPEAGGCEKHPRMVVMTDFQCGLPADHPGTCVPVGALAIPEAKPQYQPGDDE